MRRHRVCCQPDAVDGTQPNAAHQHDLELGPVREGAQAQLHTVCGESPANRYGLVEHCMLDMSYKLVLAKHQPDPHSLPPGWRLQGTYLTLSRIPSTSRRRRCRSR